MAHQATKLIIDAQLVQAFKKNYPPLPSSLPITSSDTISTATSTSSSTIPTSTSTVTATPTATSTSDAVSIPTSTSTSASPSTPTPSKPKRVRKPSKAVVKVVEGSEKSSVVESGGGKQKGSGKGTGAGKGGKGGEMDVIESTVIARQAASKTAKGNFFTKLNKKNNVVDQLEENTATVVIGENSVGVSKITETGAGGAREGGGEKGGENNVENKVKNLFREGAERKKILENISTLDVGKVLHQFDVGNSELKFQLQRRMRMMKEQSEIPDLVPVPVSVSIQDAILIDGLLSGPGNVLGEHSKKKNPTLGMKSKSTVGVNKSVGGVGGVVGSEDESSAEAVLEALYVKKGEVKGSERDSIFKRPAVATVEPVPEITPEQGSVSVDEVEKVVSSAVTGKKESKRKAPAAKVAAATTPAPAPIAAVPTASTIEVGEVAGVEGAMKKPKRKRSPSPSAAASTTPSTTPSPSSSSSFSSAPAAAAVPAAAPVAAAVAGGAVAETVTKTAALAALNTLESLPLPLPVPLYVPVPAPIPLPINVAVDGSLQDSHAPTPSPTPTPAAPTPAPALGVAAGAEVEVAVGGDPSVTYSLPVKTGFTMPEGLRNLAFTVGYGEAVKLFRLSCGMPAEGGAIPEGNGSTASLSKQVRSRGEGALRADITQKILADTEWGTAHPVNMNYHFIALYFHVAEHT